LFFLIEMKKIKLVVFFLLIALGLNAQKANLELKAAYQQAKSDLKNNKFQIAKTQFENLKLTNISSTYKPNINYYIAIADFNLNNFQSAVNQLVIIQNAFAKKENNNEVTYLLGLSYLKINDYEKAFTEFLKLEKTPLQSQVSIELAKHFSKNIDKNSLDNYKLKYINLSALNSITPKQNTKTVFDLAENQLPFLHKKAPINHSKGYYNIGLLLPFSNDTTSAALNGSQYVTDFYDGVHMAAAKLNSENIKVKLHAYSVGNTQTEMRKLLNNKSFLEEDLLIGPLHNEANKITQYYANSSQVTHVNPLSSNRQLVENKEYSFLAKASDLAYAKQAVKFANYNFIGEFAVVYEEKDSLLMKIFSKELSAIRQKYTVVKYQNAASIKGLNKQFGAIFLLSHPKSSQAIVTAIDQKYGIVPIVAHRSVFAEGVSFGTNNSIELYLFNQEFVNEMDEKIQDFKREYWNSKKNLTSYYTYLGYDMMIFWGRQMAKYKEKFIDMLSITNQVDGYLLSGFNYSTTPNENAAFTITTIENGKEVFFRKF
jgi:hypothetical protein